MDDFETELRKLIADVAHEAVFEANARFQSCLEQSYAQFSEVQVRAVKLKTQPDNAVLSRAFIAPRAGISRDDAILFNLRVSERDEEFIYPSGSPEYRGEGKGVSDAKAIAFDGGFYKRVRWPERYPTAPFDACARQWRTDLQSALNRL